VKTIEAYEKDILLQIKFLKKFKPQRQLSETIQKNTIFCGTGDSFAAALLAEAFSNFKVHAADPLDLLKNKSLTKTNHVYLVSISGNTISNINVAKIAKKSIAITSNAKSRLANACNDSIILQFPNSDVFTAGSISFLESALTCISLVKKFKIPNYYKIFKRATTISSRIKFSNRVFILGNFYTYPLAMYAAAKFYEILGIDAHYERIEQFSHMGLFSIKPRDTVIIFEDKNSHNIHLTKNLKKLGLQVIQPILVDNNKISQFLFFTFISQIVPLLDAKKKRKKDCHFVTAKKIRMVSNNMIY